MIVAKEFKFHAAHHDTDAPPGDQCGRLHGHTYVLRLEVEGPLNERGMVIHGDALKEAYREMIEPVVEHQYLNDTLPFNPTMENVASWVYYTVGVYLGTHGITSSPYLTEDHSLRVRLWETPTMFSEAP